MRLRPSMRENYRYILVEIVPEISCESRDLYRSIAESVTSLYGDSIASLMWPSVMQIAGPLAIIRCRRGMEKKLETALAAVNTILGTPAAVHSLKTSGTIKSLKESIPKERGIRHGKVVVAGKTYDAVISRRGRIDLKEKGIYLDIPRYITEEDTEDLNYDE